MSRIGTILINNFFFFNLTYTIKILLGTICTIKFCKSWERALIENVTQGNTVLVFFLTLAFVHMKKMKIATNYL
jgi:hypothetical protein